MGEERDIPPGSGGGAWPGAVLGAHFNFPGGARVAAVEAGPKSAGPRPPGRRGLKPGGSCCRSRSRSRSCSRSRSPSRREPEPPGAGAGAQALPEPSRVELVAWHRGPVCQLAAGWAWARCWRERAATTGTTGSRCPDSPCQAWARPEQAVGRGVWSEEKKGREFHLIVECA